MSQDTNLKFTRYNVKDGALLYQGDNLVASGTREETDKYLANLVQVDEIYVEQSTPEQESPSSPSPIPSFVPDGIKKQGSTTNNALSFLYSLFYMENRNWVDGYLKSGHFEDHEGYLWDYTTDFPAENKDGIWVSDAYLFGMEDSLKTPAEMRYFIIEELTTYSHKYDKKSALEGFKKKEEAPQRLTPEQFYERNAQTIENALKASKYTDGEGNVWERESYLNGDVVWVENQDTLGACDGIYSTQEMRDYIIFDMMENILG